AQHLGAHHAHTAVLVQFHGVVLGGLVETRPAAMGLELGGRAEQLGTTGPAVVHTHAVLVQQFAGPGAFGGRVPQHLVLQRVEFGLPLLIGLADLVHAPIVSSCAGRVHVGPDTAEWQVDQALTGAGAIRQRTRSLHSCGCSSPTTTGSTPPA